MNYVLVGGLAIVAALVAFRVLFKADIRRVARSMRWIVGGLAALLAAFLSIRGQAWIGALIGAGAYSILRYGRLGPIVFESGEPSEDIESSVRSRFISMTLDHASGSVEGRVVAGAFRGTNLLDLGESDTRLLLAEVASDPNSLALLETWLDKNRAGWRDYFAAQDASGQGQGSSPIDPDEEAYEVLGLKPGATAEEIRAAHHKLMKGVHPDQGGSTYLASKINEAKDRLLKKARSR